MSFPNKIICLTEESVETLFSIGKGEHIIGVSCYVKRPKEALNIQTVSAFTKSNIKKIVSLKPDLVLGYSDIQKDIAADLIKAGLNVFIANHQSVQGIFDYISLLGKMVDAKTESEKLITLCQKKIKKAHEFSKTLKVKPKVYFEEWDEPCISSILWVSEILELCGAEVIFPNDLNQHLASNRINEPEEIIKKNPDIVFLCWCGKKANIDSFKNRAGFKKIKAVKNNQIFELAPEIFLQPGPAPFIDGIDQIISIYEAWSNLDTGDR